jgi:hypothetical protein
MLSDRASEASQATEHARKATEHAQGGGGLQALRVAVAPSSDHRNLDLTVWSLFGDGYRRRGTSAPIPTWRVVGLCTVGTLISGHDVSGTGWQTLGRMIQSITTMMPVWQCGHARNDCPVNASKRSR